jgi:hypothetical protein
LNLQARSARNFAIEHNWMSDREWNFNDYFSDNDDRGKSVENVKKWLLSQKEKEIS